MQILQVQRYFLYNCVSKNIPEWFDLHNAKKEDIIIIDIYKHCAFLSFKSARLANFFFFLF